MAKKQKITSDVDLAELVKDSWSALRAWVVPGRRADALAEFLLAVERHGLENYSELDDQWPECSEALEIKEELE